MPNNDDDDDDDDEFISVDSKLPNTKPAVS